MTLESIFISTLLLADLAEPPQALQTFGLHLVGNILWCTHYFEENMLGLFTSVD